MSKKTEKQQDMEKATQSHTPRPIRDMERWFEESLPGGWMHRWEWPSLGGLPRPMETMAPRVNVIDRDDEVVVHAEVPGVKKDDLDISMTENAVTIKGSSRREEKEEKGDYYRCEIARGAFARTVSLPSLVDTEKAKASFEDGVLDLTIPKISKAKRRRIKLD